MFYSSVYAFGNRVYLFGGCVFPLSDRLTNSVVSFDIVNKEWHSLSPCIEDYDQNTPPPICDSLICYHKDCLYILGGRQADAVYVNTMYKFCMKTTTWTTVPQVGPKPLIDRKIFGTIFKNQFYIFGGSLTRGKNRFRDVSVFDFSTNRWSTRETYSKNQHYPNDRTQESMAFSSKFGYMGGGKIPNTNMYFFDIWKFNLETLEWFQLDYTLNSNIRQHSMCIVDECCLYTFGGFRPHAARFESFEMFIVQPLTLYSQCLKSICRSPNKSSLVKRLPAAILNDLNLDK
ncbi:Ras guanine nucleotide exchange factor F [Thelohanellus kitauei]|uniref:Ras guanine nucleotide exchange factor F n=1 Tax=Thelohanellus kitauei TaxID=669202 RepID=A0A0C2J743_THEKT|nr:Ras guanine nucleotide exchange factor F [Thelohanellus kitauei]